MLPVSLVDDLPEVAVREIPPEVPSVVAGAASPRPVPTARPAGIASPASPR
jgi:hypothetical protein